MFKRANKITALALAAASIMAVVPAYAADTVRLGNKDGHVYEGVSYKDGKYGYYGYRTDDDNTAIYYNNGSKDKDTTIKDTEDYSVTTAEGVKYGDKYLVATEGGNSDEYLIDLSTGKLADVDTPEDQQNAAEGRLISSLKKAERYNTTSDSSYTINDNDVTVNRLFKNKFGDTWYQYVTTSSAATLDDQGAVTTNTFGDTTTGAAIYTGFFDQNGKYIDASYTANLKVYTERKQKASVIERFGKVYKDEALKLNLKSLKALAQDKDYIYALAGVEVVYYGKDASGNYVYDDAAATTKTKNQYFIQKISKARGDQPDGAYIPKSVTAWQLDYNKDDSTLSSFEGMDETYEPDGDRRDVADAILNVSANQNGAAGQSFNVVNGALYVTTTHDSKNVKVWKLKLTNDKVKLAAGTGLDGADLHDSDDSKKVDAALVEKDKKDDTDIDTNYSWTTDADGNTWAVKDGEIKMFDNGTFVTKYKCDRSFDRIDVYDSGDLMAWDGDNDGAYTTVQEGKQQTVTDGQVVDPNLVDKTTVKTGWVQAADGSWTFFDGTGAQIKNDWTNVGGKWYFLNADGSMATGWKQVGSTWYYLDPVSGGPLGAMKTGWQQVGGTWYYMAASGAMQTGWVNDGGTWYYCNESGAMLADTTVDGYVLGSNGAWIQ